MIRSQFSTFNFRTTQSSVQVSSHTGNDNYPNRGIRGSIVTTLGTILPSFFIILAIALFFHNFKDNVIVERIFKGIRPAVVALGNSK